MNPVTVDQGTGPIILGMPHTGTYLPEDVREALNKNGALLADTDWHIDRLYADLLPDATTVTANFHRYVVDANRNPNGASLYPGQNTTALVPTTDFDGEEIWHQQPTQAETANRLEMFHVPYHKAISDEMERVKSLHGVALLYDCHSIRSHIPYLFEGELPALNIGTNGGTTCARIIQDRTEQICRSVSDYSWVLNGRFKGGWTTRNYGRPDDGFHAIQMEIAQSAYLQTQSAPWAYDTDKANKLREVLFQILNNLDQIVRTMGAKS